MNRSPDQKVIGTRSRRRLFPNCVNIFPYETVSVGFDRNIYLLGANINSESRMKLLEVTVKHILQKFKNSF